MKDNMQKKSKKKNETTNKFNAESVRARPDMQADMWSDPRLSKAVDDLAEALYEDAKVFYARYCDKEPANSSKGLGRDKKLSPGGKPKT